MRKKRKITDRDTETARAVGAAAEAVEAGGRRGILQIGSELSPAQRRAVLQVEQQHGTLPGTVIIGGRHVHLLERESLGQRLRGLIGTRS